MADAGPVLYDGLTAAELATELALPGLELLDAVPSTMDVAHALGAAGAPAGTLVLAERQTAGRGRGGRRWMSLPGSGIWMTLVERPASTEALGVLALRLGIAAAPVLDRFAGESVRLKWPNDLWLAAGKLGGILVEARWREGELDWIAVGFGLNVRAPEGIHAAAGLLPGTSRLAVLARLVPALHASALPGLLSSAELAAFDERDLARGRHCSAPARGMVAGITSAGDLRVRTNAGVIGCHSGSLLFDTEPGDGPVR